LNLLNLILERGKNANSKKYYFLFFKFYSLELKLSGGFIRYSIQ